MTACARKASLVAAIEWGGIAMGCGAFIALGNWIRLFDQDAEVFSGLVGSLAWSLCYLGTVVIFPVAVLVAFVGCIRHLVAFFQPSKDGSNRNA